jgi:hypothetical protein
MLESYIERRLVEYVKSLGGLCIKLDAQSYSGIPDRMIILPHKILFVELKQKGKKPRPLQEVWIERLRKLNQEVIVIDEVTQIPRISEGAPPTE